MKDSPELADKTSPLNRNFSTLEKILKKAPIPVSSIKKFEKEEIKVNKNYILRENMEEKDIIPGLSNENEEEIKYLEKSLERSIDKSFDKSYEKSFDKSLNNTSLNQSESNNQSLSYNDGSFNSSRNSLDGLSGKVIIQQLNKVFSGNLSINQEIEEENNDENEIDEEDNNENIKTTIEDESHVEKSINNNEEKDNSLSDNKEDEKKEEEEEEEKHSENMNHSF